MSIALTLYVVTNEHRKPERKIVGLVHVGDPMHYCPLYYLTYKNRPNRPRVRLWPEPIFTEQREAAIQIAEDEGIKLLASTRKRLYQEYVQADSAGNLCNLAIKDVIAAAEQSIEELHRPDLVLAALRLYQEYYPRARVVPFWS